MAFHESTAELVSHWESTRRPVGEQGAGGEGGIDVRHVGNGGVGFLADVDGTRPRHFLKKANLSLFFV